MPKVTSTEADNARPRRRHAAGQATRELLMVAAERLIAMNGVEGVSLTEIREAAGQSNSSVIGYHFGSQAGLVRAVLEFRYRTINARRAELLREARERGVSDDPREAVWIIVRPLVESIDAGEMFVPFLARVSANPRAFADYMPAELADSTGSLLREMAPGLMSGMTARARLGREVQLYNSVLSLLAELARGHQRISEAQLSNYVDGWVGMLTAPMSPDTSTLMGQEQPRRLPALAAPSPAVVPARQHRVVKLGRAVGEELDRVELDHHPRRGVEQLHQLSAGLRVRPEPGAVEEQRQQPAHQFPVTVMDGGAGLGGDHGPAHLGALAGHHDAAVGAGGERLDPGTLGRGVYPELPVRPDERVRHADRPAGGVGPADDAFAGLLVEPFPAQF